MKKHVRMIGFILLFTGCITGSVSAAMLSPGVKNLSASVDMIQSGTGESVVFAQNDFADALHTETVSITITSLPPAGEGTLYLGNRTVVMNSTIANDELGLLRFVPSANTRTSSFTFRTETSGEIRCVLKICESTGSVPVVGYADVLPVWTQMDMSCFGTLAGYDPDGDDIEFEIISYPTKGLLTLTDAVHGDFKYEPYVGCSGTDSFIYRVRDEYGNYSESVERTLYISRTGNEIRFDDMKDHWAHSAAIEVTAAGIMSPTTKSGTVIFDPDSVVTREEFLVMLMKTFGYKTDGKVYTTVFADDNLIRDEWKNYVAAAYQAGIIHGRVDGESRVFAPNEPITRAECAVMLNNIIGGEAPLNVGKFADNDTVPVWAQGALYALNYAGLLRGTGSGTISPYQHLTRAQTAQILLNVMQYIA